MRRQFEMHHFNIHPEKPFSGISPAPGEFARCHLSTIFAIRTLF